MIDKGDKGDNPIKRFFNVFRLSQFFYQLPTRNLLKLGSLVIIHFYALLQPIDQRGLVDKGYIELIPCPRYTYIHQIFNLLFSPVFAFKVIKPDQEHTRKIQPLHAVDGGIFSYCVTHSPCVSPDGRRSIAALAVDDATDTAFRIVAAPVPPEDEMNVGVKHGLPGRLTNISRKGVVS